MRYWVFHEQQLEPALREFAAAQATITVENVAPSSGVTFTPFDGQVIRNFLNSDAARKHGLIGGDR